MERRREAGGRTMKGCGKPVLTSRVGQDDGVNCGEYNKNIYDGEETLVLCEECVKQETCEENKK